MKEFCFSGTLGDAFIVFCKLNHYCKMTKEDIILRRYSRHISFDGIISDLFSFNNKIHYQLPCINSHNPLQDIPKTNLYTQG